MSFAKDIAKFAKKVKASESEVIRAFALDVSTKIIERSPVDTGRLRGNWQATLVNPAKGELQLDDKSGSATINKASQVAANAAGTIFYLVNNLPYAKVAEYGLWPSGYSIQAPQGMVRITVQEFRASLSKAVKGIKL